MTYHPFTNPFLKTYEAGFIVKWFWNGFHYLSFFVLWCAFLGSRGTKVNYADVKCDAGRICSKMEFGGFLCIFLSRYLLFFPFFFFFLNPQFSNPFTENVFLWRRCSGRFPLHFCFSFFFLLPSVDVDFVAQSLASGTVEEEEEEEREEQMLSSLIIIALLGKKYGKNDDGGSFKFWN